MGEGEGGMIWENGIETCILSGKKQIIKIRAEIYEKRNEGNDNKD